jgi:hypothetical protein
MAAGTSGTGGGFFVTDSHEMGATMRRRIESLGFAAIERLGVPAA